MTSETKHQSWMTVMILIVIVSLQNDNWTTAAIAGIGFLLFAVAFFRAED